MQAIALIILGGWVLVTSGVPRFEVTTPHPLSGDPIRILPEAYLAHFTQEGKFITVCLMNFTSKRLNGLMICLQGVCTIWAGTLMC